jgi:hypothetical protein
MLHDMTRETLGNHPKFVIPWVDSSSPLSANGRTRPVASSMSKQAAKPQID